MENHQEQTYKLGSFAIDEARPIKVVAIGAGFSGIIAAIRFLQRVKNVNFTIYDSNAAVGGVWSSNRYPGLACDIPSHCYQLTFEENRNWSSFYAPGDEIRQYLNDVVDKYKLRPYIKLEHRVTHAQYNEETGKWHLRIRRKNPSGTGTDLKDWADSKELEDTADVLFTGVGSLSRWSWPDIDGLHNFNGRVIHSAQWESEENGGHDWKTKWGDKRVGVIGVGSSGIQIVAALQPKVKYLANYVKGKTWISPVFTKDDLVELAGGQEVDNYMFTEKDKEAFKDDRYYKIFRSKLESRLNMAHEATIIGTPIESGAQAYFKQLMAQRLAKKPWIADHLIPDFKVACRRLTPGPGYLEALCEDNVDFIPSLIKRVTPNGIETEDGKLQELDVIICATGFDTSYQYDFSIIGRGGIDLKDHNTPHPRSYLSVVVDKFPNYFQSLGPNSGVGAGTLLLIVERQVDYAVAATLKMQRERIKSMEIKKQAVDDFDQYLESYFPKTVFGSKCRSWYKVGKEEGRVVALWPGSSAHAAKALAHPRWEDYDYEPLDNVKNCLYWLGDGETVADKDPQANKAWYLDEVDIPPVPSE